MGLTIYLPICLLFLWSIKLASANSLIVNTTHGAVLGKTVSSIESSKVDIWSSIPYGKAPIGELRFMPPEPPNSWSDVLNTTGIPNTCYQKEKSILPEILPDDTWLGGSVISEDCLYLTVVVPNPRPTNAAVIFWLYPGGNSMGSSTQTNFKYDKVVSLGNVIIVVPQYRVGAFGFLFGKDPEIPGNAGLHDQGLALRWVAENINNFGGDPGRVTLAGVSSGGAAAGLHLTSPKYSELYTRAILFSGFPNLSFATQSHEHAYGAFLYLTYSVGCFKSGNDTSTIAACLRNKTAAEIESKSNFGWFQPVYDDKMVLGETSKMLEKIPACPKKEILLGSTTDEAAMIVYTMLKEKNYTFIPEEDFELKDPDMKSSIEYLLSDLSSEIKELVVYNYKNWKYENNTMANVKSLIKIFSDYMTNCGLQQFTEFAENSGWKVYKYLFGYRTKAMYTHYGFPKWVGVTTGSDNGYLLGDPFDENDIGFNKYDRRMSKIIIKYFTNFAKTGNPNVDDNNSTTPVYWGRYKNAYGRGEKYIMTFRNRGAKFVEDQINKDCVLWDKIIPLLRNSSASSGNSSKIQEKSEPEDDLDNSSVDVGTILTITKMTKTSIINPKTNISSKIHQAIFNSIGDSTSSMPSTVNFTSFVNSKTKTKTRFSSKNNTFTIEKISKTLTKIEK